MRAGWDAVDGGTTATVVCVIRGTALVVAMVGDSSVLLLGRHPISGDPMHRVLMFRALWR